MDDSTALRATLATLYPTQEDARRVAADAGLNFASIQFSDKAINNWHELLAEAQKCGRIAALLQVSLNEYSTNPELLNFAQVYNLPTLQHSASAENHSPTIYVNTGGGAYIAGDVNTGGDFIGRDRSDTSQNSQPTQPPSSSYTSTECHAALQSQLTQHQRNLDRLQAQKSVYALGEEPLRLLNQIDHEEQEIQRIRAELAK